MQSPYQKVCIDVRSRLLLLLEVAPSLDYLTAVTRIDQTKCFSAYGSIKLPRGQAGVDDKVDSNSKKPNAGLQTGNHGDDQARDAEQE